MNEAGKAARLTERALNEGNGVLRLAPCFVARPYARPGRRLKLYPDEYYPLGLDHGAICERWFASAIHADNGSASVPDEGRSRVVLQNGEELFFSDAIACEPALIGRALYEKYGRWPSFAKFFDNAGPLAHHVHQRRAHAEAVGQEPKPEMYFFPAQMNYTYGEFPHSFFGFDPSTTKDELRAAMRAFDRGDNGLLALSRAFKLELDTGWDVPPGILHAPGSLLTYEPQFASDIATVYQSVVYYEQKLSEGSQYGNCPPERVGDVEYLVEMLDWELNVDPYFKEHRFMRPIPTVSDVREAGYQHEWICYRSDAACAKRITVLPGRTVTVRDEAAYGAICIQGSGTFGGLAARTPTLIHFGQMTEDEFFVSEARAKEGVRIANESACEELVLLCHFAENPARDALFAGGSLHA